LVRLERGQPDKARTIREQIGRVAASPMALNNNVKPLKGMEPAYRLRVGDWRVSYTLDPAADVLQVFEVASRGAAYR
jgi:mRNA interferase RelE/StbE